MTVVLESLIRNLNNALCNAIGISYQEQLAERGGRAFILLNNVVRGCGQLPAEELFRAKVEWMILHLDFCATGRCKDHRSIPGMDCVSIPRHAMHWSPAGRQE